MSLRREPILNVAVVSKFSKSCYNVKNIMNSWRSSLCNPLLVYFISTCPDWRRFFHNSPSLIDVWSSPQTTLRLSGSFFDLFVHFVTGIFNCYSNFFSIFCTWRIELAINCCLWCHWLVMWCTGHASK